MAGPGEQPYVQFNFLIDFGAGGPGPHGGFQECSCIGIDKTVAEYDRASEKPINVQKIKGLNKSTDVTLKRGVVGARAFDQWLGQSRVGAAGADRTITITLQGEHHETGQTWKLLRARIIKHVSGPFNAKATDMAIEELTIACERLEMK
ncbi:MAG TPA: phage tail protein [Pyrinomonadaceae bacterium]|nr:phage tail protein [Pyrinomonadaceae bacterium]